VFVQKLDAGWLQSLLRLPIPHAFCITLSLSLPLLHSAHLLLNGDSSTGKDIAHSETVGAPSSGSISAVTSDELPDTLPSAFLSSLAKGASLRSKLATKLQQLIAEMTQGRITVRVQT
jgi:hypothetical protein